MNRRTLLQAGAALAALPLLPRVALACDHGAKAAAVPQKVVARIGKNHGHVFLVPLADVEAGVEKTYDLTGTAAHPHEVTLTADHFQRIRDKDTVRIPSSRQGHLHRLLVKVAPAVDPPESINACDVEIGGQDDHEIIIPAADIAAKIDRTYDIQGLAGHTHALTLTAADFDKLSRNQPARLVTGPGAEHTHVVILRYPLETKAS